MFISNYKKVAFVLTATLLSVSSLVLFSLIATVIAWATVCQRLIRKQLYLSWLTALAAGFLVFASLNMLIGMGLRLASWQAPLIVNVIVQLALWLAASRAISGRATDKQDRADAIVPHWIIIAFVIAVIASFAAPFIKPTTASLVGYSSMGFDDSSHIPLFHADIQTKELYYYNYATIGPRMSVGLAGYPQGLHYSLAVFARGIFALTHTTDANVKVLLWSYHIGLACWYAALVVLSAEIVTQLTGEFAPRRRLGLAAQFVVGAVILLAYATLIFPQILFAGETFLGNMALFAGLLLCLIFYGRAVTRQRQYIFYGLAGLFATGITYTWLVSALVAYPALALAFALQLPNAKLGATKTSLSSKAFWRALWIYMGEHKEILLFIASFALSLPQVIVQMIYEVTGTASTLNTDGGIQPLNHTLYLNLAALVLVAAVVVSVRYTAARARNTLTRTLLLFSPFILVIFFFAFQTLTAGTLTYYFTKSAYMAYFFMLLAIGVVFACTVATIAQRAGRLGALCLGVLIVSLLGIYLSVTKAFLQYTKGDNPYVSRHLTETTATLLDKGVRPMNIVSYTNRVYEEDMLFDRLTANIDEFTPAMRRELGDNVMAKNQPLFLRNLAIYVQRPVTTYILVSSKTMPIIQHALPANGNYKIVIVKE